MNAMSSKISNHLDMAIPSCPISTIRSAMDAMNSKISNHLDMATHSCPISTIGSAMDAMSSKFNNHIQEVILSCSIGILTCTFSRNRLIFRIRGDSRQTKAQQG